MQSKHRPAHQCTWQTTEPQGLVLATTTAVGGGGGGGVVDYTKSVGIAAQARGVLCACVRGGWGGNYYYDCRPATTSVTKTRRPKLVDHNSRARFAGFCDGFLVDMFTIGELFRPKHRIAYVC